MAFKTLYTKFHPELLVGFFYDFKSINIRVQIDTLSSVDDSKQLRAFINVMCIQGVPKKRVKQSKVIFLTLYVELG